MAKHAHTVLLSIIAISLVKLAFFDGSKVDTDHSVELLELDKENIEFVKSNEVTDIRVWNPWHNNKRVPLEVWCVNCPRN